MADRPLLDSLAELARAAEEKLRNRLAANEVAKHLLAADKEVLLAVRAMIDGKIKWIESLTQVPPLGKTGDGPA